MLLRTQPKEIRPPDKPLPPHTRTLCVLLKLGGGVALIFYVNIYLYLHENRHDSEAYIGNLWYSANTDRG